MYYFQLDIIPTPELNYNQKLFCLNVNLIDARSEQLQHILQIMIENIEELYWFVENELSIRNEKFPIAFTGNDSIAKAIEYFYNNIDADSNEDSNLIDDIYDYRSRHGIRFGFRGQNIDDVYIGLNNNDTYELSCSEDNKIYTYIVDINSLFDQVKKQLIKTE